MTLVFYWDPAAPTSRKATLTRGQVKAVFDADRVRHLASAAGGDTWWIERHGRESVVKIPTSDYKLSWVAREIEGLKRGACDNVVRVEGVEQVTFSIGKRVVITFEYVDGLVIDEAIAPVSGRPADRFASSCEESCRGWLSSTVERRSIVT